GLRRREEAGGEDEVLEPRGPEEVEEAGVRLHGETVPERPRDGGPEARVGGRDPEVARGGDAKAAPDGEPLDLGDDRLPDRFQPADPAIAVALVGDAGLRRLEDAELADVGAGHEGLSAGPAEDQDPDPVVGVDLLAGPGQALVHVP